MSDIHALSGAYAVDALDDAERADFENHLAQCAECRAEVASFRETAALMAETEAVEPPPSLRDDVLAGISRIRPLPPQTPVDADEEPSAPGTTDELAVRRRRWLPSLLATAAAVVLLAVGVLAWHPWQDGGTSTSLADQIVAAPDAMKVSEKVPGGGELTLVRSASLGKAVLIGHDVPAAPPGKTYQMWLQQPGAEMVSAGLMPDASRPTVLSGDAADAAAAAVSIEPERGSVHPSKDVVAVFPLKPDESGNGGA